MTVDMLPWVLARSSGIVAYVLLAAAMSAGLLVRSRARLGPLRPAQLVDAHQQLSLLSLIAVGVHGLALVADTTVDISWLALVVPGMVPYRPVWTAVGVIAAELMVLVQLTSRFRRNIGARVWRRLHMLAYGVFVLATVHGIAAGTDTGQTWALALYGGAVATVTSLTAWRITAARRGSPSRPPARGRAGRTTERGAQARA